MHVPRDTLLYWKCPLSMRMRPGYRAMIATDRTLLMGLLLEVAVAAAAVAMR